MGDRSLHRALHRRGSDGLARRLPCKEDGGGCRQEGRQRLLCCPVSAHNAVVVLLSDSCLAPHPLLGPDSACTDRMLAAMFEPNGQGSSTGIGQHASLRHREDGSRKQSLCRAHFRDSGCVSIETGRHRGASQRMCAPRHGPCCARHCGLHASMNGTLSARGRPWRTADSSVFAHPLLTLGSAPALRPLRTVSACRGCIEHPVSPTLSRNKHNVISMGEGAAPATEQRVER